MAFLVNIKVFIQLWSINFYIDNFNILFLCICLIFVPVFFMHVLVARAHYLEKVVGPGRGGHKDAALAGDGGGGRCGRRSQPFRIGSGRRRWWRRRSAERSRAASVAEAGIFAKFALGHCGGGDVELSELGGVGGRGGAFAD